MMVLSGRRRNGWLGFGIYFVPVIATLVVKLLVVLIKRLVRK